MNSATISVTEPHPAHALDRLTMGLLLGFVAALQLSIALAQILLAALLVSWVVMRIQDRTRPSAPPFFLSLLAYGILTLVSSAFSVDPATSFIDDKQLLLLAIVPVVYDIARGPRATSVAEVVITVGAASALVGILQYGVLHYDNLGQRPQGALTHYMTYSGALMLVTTTAAARLLFGARDRIWPALVMPALVVALALTFTRNAWIGTCFAVGLLFILKDFRLAALLPAILAALFVIAPDGLANRLTSTFNAQDPANQDRFAMIEIGARIVADRPLTGVGPNMVPRVYEEYRPDYAVNQVNPHLHNVPLQIAAERGLPALAVWLWFVGATVLALWRMFRQQRERVLTTTALAAMAGMLAAGLFEYNFGDSEFLMLFLVLITLPFAAARQDDASSARP
ncbi:MAG: O-antigen ligase family protein [Acidobacteria bacterium]|nr:O-antigen ligase family protein [Acidobacteriota bacterium]